MLFLNLEHQKRFENCIYKDESTVADAERSALFYILTGSEDIWNKGITNIYDFFEHAIRPSCVKGKTQIKFCSSSRKMVLLAFNLYNGFESRGERTDPANLFSSLDENNFKLAMDAIKIRFGG